MDIKVREWCKILGSMFYEPVFHEYESINTHLNDGRLFMLSTGRKDKNNNLIYDGDIIFANGKKYLVKFTGLCFILTSTDSVFRDYLSNLTHLNRDVFEVIGNIHETPELLKD